ncbi:MAG: hypothetical protein MRY64_16270 [Hyphomonadaceae bacterium]|nr:hypothetical protein [Hyphomonadaceae bacterium]
MKSKADNLIIEFASILSSYGRNNEGDRDYDEIHKLAEASLEMLVLIRQHQLERIHGDDLAS